MPDHPLTIDPRRAAKILQDTDIRNLANPPDSSPAYGVDQVARRGSVDGGFSPEKLLDSIGRPVIRRQIEEEGGAERIRQELMPHAENSSGSTQTPATASATALALPLAIAAGVWLLVTWLFGD